MSEMDYEKVIKLRPDVVLVGFGILKLQRKTEPCNNKVIYLNLRTMAHRYKRWLILWTQRGEIVLGIITWKTKYEDQLRNIICEIGLRTELESTEKATTSSGTLVNESGLNSAITAAGGRNIASTCLAHS